jgi:hypothetical protein
VDPPHRHVRVVDDRDLRPRGVGEALGVGDDRGVGLVAGRAGHPDVDPGQGAGLEQAVGHVVAVAHIGQTQALEAPEVAPQGHEVGQRLAGVVAIGEGVDHGDGGGAGAARDVVVGEGSDDEGAGIAAHDPGGVLDGLAPPELELGRPYDLGGASQARDGRREGQPGAR